MALSIFFWSSCSWQSEGLFVQSFSIAPPIQALTGLLFLGSLSVVQCIRRIEVSPPLPLLESYSVDLCIRHLRGASWMGSYSVVQCIRRLIGQPLSCLIADAGHVGRERDYGDGSTHCVWLRSIALLPWLPGFPLQAFSTTVSSLTSPGSVSSQSTVALTLGLLHNP